MIFHNLGTGQSFGTGHRDGRLFGSATLPAFAFNPPTTPSAPIPTAAPTTQMGLLGADPSRARADAFLRSLGAMAPGLLMAGAPSTDPGQRGKGLAMAFGAQPQAFQQDLARVRAENVQKMNLQMAQAKAARERKLFEVQMAKNAMLQNMLKGMGGVQQPQGQPVQPQSMGNVMNGPNAMVMPKAVQTPQATTGPASPRGLLGLSQPMVMSILASDDPAGALNRTLLQRNDPSKMYTPDGRLTAKGQSDMEKTYRSELKPVLEKVQEVDRKMRMVQSGIADQTGTGDIQAVTSFIKMIDDGVVTAGELAVQQGAQSLIGQMRTWKATATKGDILNPTLRANLLRLAGAIEQDTYASYRPQVALAKKGALELGLRWDTQVWRGGPKIFGNRKAATKPKTVAASNNVATVPKELATTNPNTGEKSLHEPIVPSAKKFKLRHDTESSNKPEPTTSSPVTQTSLPAPITVSFDGQESDLKGENNIANLQNLAAKIKGSRGNRVQLRAFAGGGDLSAKQARRLSLSRALAIRSALIARGVKSTDIDVRALGSKTSGPNMNRVDIKIMRR